MAGETDEEAAEETPPGKGKGKKIVLVLVLVGLAGGGSGGAYLAFRGDSHAKKARPTIGPTLPIESFIVNLNEQGSLRYLKVTMELEMSHALEEESRQLVPRLRDQVLLYLSGLTMAQAMKPETKHEVKKTVLEIANRVFGHGAVRAVYFKEYVMQ